MKKKCFRCGSFRILLLLCLFVSTQTVAMADIVKGRVVDAETKEALPDAMVKHTQRFGDSGYSMKSTKTDSLGMFAFSANGRGSIEVSMLGYYTKSKPVLAFSDSNKDTLDIGTIELKMSPQMMKMVEVTGRARRFTVKGDTIVFHPEAFHLQEGARLDELIKKLPGVEVDDEGKLSWNGKPIRITMDGESLFGGDDLVKQLPAEAVQDIKAYNKQSEFSERTGKDDGTQDMVLDLSIKPGFLDRWYGDVKAGYQTKKYYDGELMMNRLSKTDPVMVFANANSIDRHWRRNMNGSSAYMGSGFGKELGASTGYQHNWQRKEGTHDLKSNYSFTGGLAHDDDWRTSNQLTETYLPNTAATRSSSESYQRNHKLEPRLNASLKWVRDSLNTFTMSASAEHNSSRSQSHQATEQEEAFGSEYAPTISQLTETHTDGREASVTLNYQDGKTDVTTDRTITAHNLTHSSSQLIQTYTSPSKQFSTYAEAHHARWLTKKWMMQAQYALNYNRNLGDRDFLTNGVADATNSYHNLYTRNEHCLRLAQTFNLTPFQLMPDISARWQGESQDYRRGQLDTAAVRRHFFIDPSLRATWKLSKTVGFELSYSFKTSLPDIIQTIGYRDLTDPLFITEGNPNLRSTHTHDVKLTYNMVLARSQTSFSATVNYNHKDREAIDALSYTPATAVYVSRPENIRGSKSWNFRLNFDQGLGDYLRLQNDFRMNASRRYGFLTLIPSQSERIVNRQSSLNPSERLTFSLDYNWLKASAFAEINADRLRYTASPEQNTTHWNNNYGLSFEATYRNFVFYSSLTERTSRGYTMESMNRDILVWNAAIGWKIVKNNHYIGISFAYHLDAKKKE